MAEEPSSVFIFGHQKVTIFVFNCTVSVNTWSLSLNKIPQLVGLPIKNNLLCKQSIELLREDQIFLKVICFNDHPFKLINWRMLCYSISGWALIYGQWCAAGSTILCFRLVWIITVTSHGQHMLAIFSICFLGVWQPWF